MSASLLELLDVRAGHFALESGHHGERWMDLDALFRSPATLAPLVDALGRRLAPHQIAVVCGPLTGGAFLAQMIASSLGLDFAYAERDATGARSDALYGVRYRLPPGLRRTIGGRRVGIVDDVISAGSAVGGTLADLRAAGAHPIVMGALLVLGDVAPALAQRNGLGFEALATLPGGIWKPDMCPHCAAGTPLEAPVGG